jgi:hypothetical protein
MAIQSVVHSYGFSFLYQFVMMMVWASSRVDALCRVFVHAGLGRHMAPLCLFQALWRGMGHPLTCSQLTPVSQ